MMTPSKATRIKRLARIHILWKELRPDLRFSDEDRKQELRAYACTVLDLPELASLGDLTDGKISKLLDALVRESSSPRLPGQTLPEQAFRVPPSGGSPPFVVPPSGTQLAVGLTPAPSAEVIHLATEAQVWAINRLWNHLNWSPDARSKFLKDRFNRAAPRFLTPRQANKLITILLTITASAEIKKEAEDRGEPLKRVSRAMAQGRFPQLKRELGIGQVIR
jgi:hypothetical protein